MTTKINSQNNTKLTTAERKKKIEQEKAKQAVEQNKKAGASVFTEEQQAKQQPASFDQIISNLNSKGIATTNTAGEANFSDYGNALSDDLKQQILASYDSDADFELQAKLAGIFKSTNVVQTNDFISMAQGMGFTVNSEYQATSYIQDNKAVGATTQAIQGSINVLTISDPSTGAEIKIADANGNAAIESEELFMNEILQGISTNIDSIGTEDNIAVSESSAFDFENEYIDDVTTEELDKEIEEDNNLTYAQYENKLQEMTTKYYNELKTTSKQRQGEDTDQYETRLQSEAQEKAKNEIKENYTIPEALK